jgi:hypothetical protein
VAQGVGPEFKPQHVKTKQKTQKQEHKTSTYLNIIIELGRISQKELFKKNYSNPKCLLHYHIIVVLGVYYNTKVLTIHYS